MSFTFFQLKQNNITEQYIPTEYDSKGQFLLVLGKKIKNEKKYILDLEMKCQPF